MGTLPKSALVAGLFLLGTTSSVLAEWPPQYGTPSEDQGNAQGDPHWILDEVTQCWAYDAHAGSDDTITWSGDCSDGKISGHGTLTYFDHGRMFERVTGEFSEGYLRDGRVAIVWNDGSRYDGGEQNGQFNGYGTLIASDGTRYEGMWKDDKFLGGNSRNSSAQQSIPTNIVNPQPQPKPIAKVDLAQRPRAPNNKHENKNEKVYRLPWTQFAKVLGKTLVAADGSKLTFERTETGSLRETIEHPEGASLAVTFVPLGAHLGTVQDSTGKIVATFRLNDRTLSAAFDDGRVETASATSTPSVRTYLRRAGARVVATDWYPIGHVFLHAANDPPPAKPLQRPDPPAPIDPPRIDPMKVAAVRSIQMRTYAPEAVRRAQGATLKAQARMRPAPSEKPAEFALDVPRPARRPERLPLFARHMDDRHEPLVIRPHTIAAQSITPQINIETLTAAPISAASQRRIALALRHREKKHEQLAITAIPLTRVPAEATAALAPIAPHVASNGARNDTASTDVRVMPTPPSAVPKPQLNLAKPVRVATDSVASPEQHAAQPAKSLEVNTARTSSPLNLQAMVPAKPVHPSASNPVSAEALAAQPTKPNAMLPPSPPKAQATVPTPPVLVAQARPTPANTTQPKHVAVPAPGVPAKPARLAVADPAPTPLLAVPAKRVDAMIPAPSISKAQIAAQLPSMKLAPAVQHNAAPARQIEDSTDATKPTAASAMALNLTTPSAEKPASVPQQSHPVSVPRLPTDAIEMPPTATPAAPAITTTQPTPAPNATPVPQLAALPKHDDKHGAVAAVVSALSSSAIASPAPPAAAAPPVLHTIGIGPVPRRSASDCLTVESNGTHWGFHNHCPADIQFSYCLLNSSDRLISCSTGAASGSVAGNGFSALVADTSIKDPRANRAFRWVGCVGGAGEVSPRLDRIDPPMGRCLHSGQIPEGVERADVTVHRR